MSCAVLPPGKGDPEARAADPTPFRVMSGNHPLGTMSGSALLGGFRRLTRGSPGGAPRSPDLGSSGISQEKGGAKARVGEKPRHVVQPAVVFPRKPTLRVPGRSVAPTLAQILARLVEHTHTHTRGGERKHDADASDRSRAGCAVYRFPGSACMGCVAHCHVKLPCSAWAAGGWSWLKRRVALGLPRAPMSPAAAREPEGETNARYNCLGGGTAGTLPSPASPAATPTACPDDTSGREGPATLCGSDTAANSSANLWATVFVGGGCL